MSYMPRVLDGLLADLVSGLPAIAIEGAKGVGKTETAKRLAAASIELDQDGFHDTVQADPRVIAGFPHPTLIDEWQLVEKVWDEVRREVDRDHTPGKFILTGSAVPSKNARIHSGAGRIVRVVMRPMTLAERGVEVPTVSFEDLLSGRRPSVSGHSDMTLRDYAEEICASGFPGIRQEPARFRPRQLDSYIAHCLERDIPELGVNVRRPHALRAWLTAFAAASATTASYTTILDAATPGEAEKLSRPTATAYRELLERTWLLDSLPAWIPAFNPLKRLGSAPKHHLVDPALAARLLGATPESLLSGEGSPVPVRREGTLLGALFESLAALTVRVLAEPSGSTVAHLRLANGEHEIGIIVERGDHKVIAIEVKLAAAVDAADVKHLNWLEEMIGGQLLDKVILNTGPIAHRLPDGTAVVPLALLGL
jgi:predicted AAA+ superfamily ATPase